ncbi:hypothetical protein Athai_67210 [Actinocatenispora thailandica]|uniref:Uncharacterized protein n=1 Tax=Actinocatenispora thailandica TaxID=227318 RepID=A0A7R7I1N7_9ACTN|nr:hypothetical protein [Actinocatenispora thailandica]BCJ39218.1 hypothetical protein Athai_67210 [Actinocatenispora thailandica]
MWHDIANAEFKPVQLQVAHELGLTVPRQWQQLAHTRHTPGTKISSSPREITGQSHVRKT